MSRGVGISSLERFYHEFEQFFVRLLEFKVRAVNLTKTENRCPKSSGCHGPEHGIDPGEDEDQRDGDDIESGDRASILTH